MNASKVKVIVMGVAILFIVPATATAQEHVYFADANLEYAVEQALGITDPTPADMLELTRLNATHWGIVDLTGIEYATNLKILQLDSNQISDLSPLSGMTNLQSLTLYHNQIRDISDLSRLTNLIDLWLLENQIIDISPLSGLTKLKHLRLSSNQISDISALPGLTNLIELSLITNQVSDISPLSGLTNLTHLDLGDNQISDISALSGLNKLGILGLSDNPISDFSALLGLTNLYKLSLCGNQISDISVLSGLTNLTCLALHQNQVSDISALSKLTNLLYLDLNRNPLNRDAHCVYIPMIRDNNPGVYITYDPNPYVCSLSVEIDIKPGSYPNAINLGSFGLVPVAILSSDGFDATTVDPDTVELAGSGVAVRGKGSKLMAHEEDVNGDGWLDLIVQVVTENLDPGSFQDGYAVLTGKTYDGVSIEGSDEITIVPPE